MVIIVIVCTSQFPHESALLTYCALTCARLHLPASLCTGGMRHFGGVAESAVSVSGVPAAREPRVPPNHPGLRVLRRVPAQGNYVDDDDLVVDACIFNLKVTLL